MSYSITWDKIFKEFSEKFIRAGSRDEYWYPSGQLEITVKVDDRTRMRYDYVSKTARRVAAPRNGFNGIREEDEWRDEFAYRLNRRMRLRGISAGELADATGISRATLSKYLNGRATPTGYMLYRLATELGCSMSELGSPVDYGM